MGEQGVERGPDLADLGPFIHEVVGHPFGEPDLSGGEWQHGDPFGGGGDLAQRPQLAAYDDQLLTDE